MNGPYTVEAGAVNWRDFMPGAQRFEQRLLFNGKSVMKYKNWRRSQLVHLCDMANRAYFEGVRQCQKNFEDPSGDYAPDWHSGMNTTT